MKFNEVLYLEFMVSIAIISIAIGISLHIYMQYIEKAKIIEAIGLLGDARIPLIEYYSYHGYWPNKNLIEYDVNTWSNYTKIINYENSGILNAILKNNMNGDNLILSLRPIILDEQPKIISWLCGYAQPPAGFILQNTENYTNVSPYSLPHVCRI